MDDLGLAKKSFAPSLYKAIISILTLHNKSDRI